MEAHLPADKLLYLQDLLQLWTNQHHCSLCNLQQLIGFLQFCSQVIPHSQAFLCHLISFSMTFQSQYAVQYLPAYALAEIRWWHTLTLQPGMAYISLCPPIKSFMSLQMQAAIKGLVGSLGINGSRAEFPGGLELMTYNSKKSMQSYKQSCDRDTTGSTSMCCFTLITRLMYMPLKMTQIAHYTSCQSSA